MPLKLLSFRAVDSAGVQFMMCELSDICYPTVPVARYVSGPGPLSCVARTVSDQSNPHVWDKLLTREQSSAEGPSHNKAELISAPS